MVIKDFLGFLGQQGCNYANHVIGIYNRYEFVGHVGLEMEQMMF